MLGIVWDLSWSLARSSAPGLPSGCLASSQHGHWVLRMSVLRKKPREAEWLFLFFHMEHFLVFIELVTILLLFCLLVSLAMRHTGS